jgi:hypothetical protein
VGMSLIMWSPSVCDHRLTFLFRSHARKRHLSYPA